MKFPALVLSSFCAAAVVSAPGLAWSHIDLTAPMPRVPDTDNIKSGPCGPMPRNAARVTTAKPGETITVEWDETVPHPGYFRILFDEEGQDGLVKPSTASFKAYSDYYNKGTNVSTLPKLVMGPVKEGGAWVLADNWGLHPAGGKKKWSLKVTLPNVTCSKCTLQVVQGMFESSRTYEGAYYFHCADFVLQGAPVGNADGGATPSPDAGVAGAGGNGGMQGGAGGSLNAGGSAGKGGTAGAQGSGNNGGAGGEASGGDGGGAGSGDRDEKSSGGGCEFARPRAGTAGILMLVAVGLFLSRRRRR